MSRIVKGKKVYKLGGSFAEIAIVDKKKDDKDKLNNTSVIIATNIKDKKISDEKLKKFINLKIT